MKTMMEFVDSKLIIVKRKVKTISKQKLVFQKRQFNQQKKKK